MKVFKIITIIFISLTVIQAWAFDGERDTIGKLKQDITLLNLLNGLNLTGEQTRGLLKLTREVALGAGLRYAYITNLPGHIGGDTYCPNCQKAIIQRAGFETLNIKLRNGRCIFCGVEVAGLWRI